MILALALTLFASDVHVGTVRIVGPLESVTFEAAGRHRTEITLNYREGEEHTFRVPFTSSAVGGGLPPVIVEVDPPDAEVEFVEWEEVDERWDSIPPGLRSRTRPPLTDPAEDTPIGFLLVITATGILVLGLKRSPLRALAAGVAGALVLLFPGIPELREWSSHSTRVLEGAAGDSWLRVAVSSRAIVNPEDLPVRIETVPADGPIHWDVGYPSGGGHSYYWQARADGRPLHIIDDIDPGPRSLARDLNTWGDLLEVWTRGEGGGWASHGRWPLGMPLPPEQDGLGAPPSWLASGLPQGTGILLGRLAPESFLGEGTTWIRLTGF